MVCEFSGTSEPLIKGNIGSGGDKIFHTPNSQFYDRTIIDESTGERWFCTTEEAVAAGWRAPKRSSLQPTPTSTPTPVPSSTPTPVSPSPVCEYSGTSEPVIKGNIGSSGDKIYHVPDSQYYSQTNIDESKGERWFCTVEEATGAGWRAPL